MLELVNYLLENPELKRNFTNLLPDLVAIALMNTLVISCAEISDTTAPKKNVKAKPLTTDVPIQKRMIATIIAAICESRIDVHARANPSSTASRRPLPFLISSFIRSKVSTFASTATPTEIRNPAIPAHVSVTGISLKSASIIAL